MMWATASKYIGGKVLSAILVVGVGSSLIWFWNHPDKAVALWEAVKGALLWIGFSAALPWGLFFVTAKVVKADSNAAGAGLLAFLMLIDVLVAFWLCGWSVPNTIAWVVLIVGFLAAGVYNFLVCDFVAEKIDDAI